MSDSEQLANLHSQTFPNSPLIINKKHLNKFIKLTMYDKEQRGVKFRKSTFIGCRVPISILGGFSSATMKGKGGGGSPTGNSGRRESLMNNSMTRQAAFFQSSFEKMKDAVMSYINRKKELEKTQLLSHKNKDSPNSQRGVNINPMDFVNSKRNSNSPGNRSSNGFISAASNRRGSNSPKKRGN